MLPNQITHPSSLLQLSFSSPETALLLILKSFWSPQEGWWDNLTLPWMREEEVSAQAIQQEPHLPADQSCHVVFDIANFSTGTRAQLRSCGLEMERSGARSRSCSTKSTGPHLASPSGHQQPGAALAPTRDFSPPASDIPSCQ